MHTCRYTLPTAIATANLHSKPHRYYSPNLSDRLPSMCMDPEKGWGLLKSSERGQVDSEVDGISWGRPAEPPSAHWISIWAQVSCSLCVEWWRKMHPFSVQRPYIWDVGDYLSTGFGDYSLCVHTEGPEVGFRKAAHYYISIRITLPSLLGSSPQGASLA